VAAHPELELHGMVVLHDGATVFEQYWAPYEPDDRALVYSVSKTFSATAVGLAIAEGRFGLDDRLVDLLVATVPELPTTVPGLPTTVPEEVALRPSRRAAADRVAQLTVHHLLSMSTGHTEDTLEAMTDGPPEEWVQRFLAIRPQQPVGSCHVYNNGASFLLGELVRRHTGEDLVDYLRPRLFEPLGIDAAWDRDPLGRCLGWTGLHLRTRDLAAMGELLRCDGVWRGRRLLPEGWVARATAEQIPTSDTKPEWTFGYGYQVWMGREGYRLDGAYGQFSFVLPERRLVVAIQSAQSCTQTLVDLLWEHLDASPVPEEVAPLLEPVPEEVALRPSRRATIPVPTDSGAGTTWTAAGPVPLDPEMVDPGEEIGRPADVADVTATRTDQGIELKLTADGYPVHVVAVPGEWCRQRLQLGDAEVPVAVAAGADESGDLHVRLVFTDTPHTLRLRLGADHAAQAWRVNPLQGPGLAAMRAR
jgi:CubicO group peptidase (beta-lactamase class C family)